MKKLFIVLAMVLPMVASAQKFGHINTTELFTQMPEMAQVKLKMDTIQSQYETQISMMQEEIQKKYQEYQQQQATMPDAIKQVREQEIQDMQQRLQLFYQNAEQDIQKKQQELVAPLHEKMSKAIQAVGEKLGFTYIFESAAMVYIAPTAVDVTADVKKELGMK
ncbi:MAG: OmpH family outer membrane protein [Paludibacteraceae bacterium]|nr:OmpH family outer membrane protein [Paludibacteraceae bacterium]